MKCSTWYFFIKCEQIHKIVDLLTFTKEILNAKLHWFVECMKWLHFYRFHWPENSGKSDNSALCQTESLKWILIWESSDKKYFRNYLLKVNIRDTGIRCEKCSKLTIKTLERRHWRRSTVFYANFEHTSLFVLVFLLLI